MYDVYLASSEKVDTSPLVDVRLAPSGANPTLLEKAHIPSGNLT